MEAALFTTLLGQQTVTAAVPSSLAEAALKAGLLHAAGSSATALPEELGEAEVRQFLLQQIEVKHLSYAAYRQIYAALTFLYTVTLTPGRCLVLPGGGRM